jgi:hypothetical protein
VLALVANLRGEEPSWRRAVLPGIEQSVDKIRIELINLGEGPPGIYDELGDELVPVAWF